MADLFTLQVPTPSESRDSMLRTTKNGLIQRGIPTPNVNDQSDFYVEYTAVGNELSVNASNGILSADQVNEDTAQGDFLIIPALKKYGLSPRDAGGSFGTIIANCSSPGLVAFQEQLTDDNGLRYEVSVGGTYSNGDAIPVDAVDTGEATNLAQGASLQWRNAPAFFAPTALVGLGGLVNGVDSETQENFRQRVLARMANPPASGNWEHCAEIAEASSPSVQKAFPFPAVQGPGTVHIAMTAAPTATNSSRAINATLMSTTISPYIQGKLPQHVYTVNTGTVDAAIDCAIGIAIPSSPSASPAGPGGGWLDGTPFPVRVAAGAAQVSSVTSASIFQIQSDLPPTPGVSKIAWFNYNTRQVLKATVVSYTGSAGFWTITIDTPFTGIANVDHVMPQAANTDLYVTAVLAAFELMGPAEKSSNASALIRGYRHPVPSSGWVNTVGPSMLKAVTDSATEVSNAQFNLRAQVPYTTIVGPNGVSTLPASDVYATISDPPLIFIPKNISFYPLV